MDARPALDWPNLLLLTATGGAIAVVIACVISMCVGRGDATSLFLAMFMACFSLVKFAVAARAVRDVRAVDARRTAGTEATASARAGDDPRELYGTPGRFWIWVGMKTFAAVLALGAAIFIVAHGPGSLR